MCLVIRNQPVYIRGADVLLVQVEHGDIRIILEHHAGNNLVADLYRLSGAVLRNILSEFYNLSGSFMSQRNRDQAKGIFLKFMLICSADSRSLYSDQDVIIANLRDRKFLNVIVAQSSQHGDVSGLRNLSRRCGSRRRSCSGCTGHPGQYLLYNLLDIC